jgi:hypothetical protein
MLHVFVSPLCCVFAAAAGAGESGSAAAVHGPPPPRGEDGAPLGGREGWHWREYGGATGRPQRDHGGEGGGGHGPRRCSTRLQPRVHPVGQFPHGWLNGELNGPLRSAECSPRHMFPAPCRMFPERRRMFPEPHQMFSA